MTDQSERYEDPFWLYTLRGGGHRFLLAFAQPGSQYFRNATILYVRINRVHGLTHAAMIISRDAVGNVSIFQRQSVQDHMFVGMLESGERAYHRGDPVPVGDLALMFEDLEYDEATRRTIVRFRDDEQG